MKKAIFENIISKYFINDEIDSVLIGTENNIIKIPFRTKSGSPLGYIKYDNFDTTSLDFGVYNHANLLKNVKIMSDDFNIEQIGDKLFFKDGSITIEYFSQMKETIDYINEIDDIYAMEDIPFDVTYIFDKEFVTKFLKVTSVDKYEVQDTFTIKENKKNNAKFEVKVGKLSKIKFDIELTRLTDAVTNIIASVDDFINIFSKNKDCVEGCMYLKQGLIKLSFTNADQIYSTYFLPTVHSEH